MTDKLWLLPFGPDQIHLPTLHSPDSGGFLVPHRKIARGFMRGITKSMVARLLHNQHAVAIREEAVFFFHGLGVGLEDEFAVGKSGDEHDQGGLG